MSAGAPSISRGLRNGWESTAGNMWRVAQGLRQGVRQDVNVPELPGRRAQSAVILVHLESPRQAPCGESQKEAAQRLAVRSGCYHSGYMNVL